MTAVLAGLAVLLGLVCAVDRTARALTAGIATCAALWALVIGAVYLAIQGGSR